ncbi:hypothetical protein [Helicobacter suis]|uniref:hypothetical protein n=1 Tax=Helicobacter suis TaxID=104628 RepID=UPI001E3DDC25|nr:hypothetical protein [Helicobacter suis]
MLKPIKKHLAYSLIYSLEKEPISKEFSNSFKTLRQKSHSSLAGGMNAPYP